MDDAYRINCGELDKINTVAKLIVLVLIALMTLFGGNSELYNNLAVYQRE